MASRSKQNNIKKQTHWKQMGGIKLVKLMWWTWQKSCILNNSALSLLLLLWACFAGRRTCHRFRCSFSSSIENTGCDRWWNLMTYSLWPKMYEKLFIILVIKICSCQMTKEIWYLCDPQQPGMVWWAGEISALTQTRQNSRILADWLDMALFLIVGLCWWIEPLIL